jgi:hypothetical protein
MKCYIQLADYGALLNLLPLCLADAESGEKSCIVTTKPYADLLEGVSYVDCKVVDCQPYEMDKAVDWTLDHGLRPGICTQVNGPAELVKRYTYEPVGQKSAVTTSWQKEQWKVAGRLDRWDDCLPLKFDRRNLVRETRLWRDTFPAKNLGKKPIMLLALNGNSSPFPNKDLLAYLLKTTFGDRWRIVEIPKAACLYDLLGFYEKASLLVAVDSAPLHLAWAVRSLPVIAFANDQPIMWAGSSWRPNMVWYCRYGDFLSRWKEMLGVIDKSSAGPIWSDPKYQFIDLRIWSEYEVKNSRDENYRFWHHLAIGNGYCGRDSAGILNDSKRVPYLKDCIRMAIQRTTPGRTIVLTRPDVIADDDISLYENEACYAYRMQEGNFAPICDLFTAPREWWKDALQDIPDLLLDSGYWWSETLRAVFLRRGAVDITGVCSRPKPEKSSPPLTEIPPRMKHNRELCEKYMTDNGVTARYPAVSEQVETLPLDTSKLYPGGYNPTIIEHDGKLLMAYRYHGDTLATSLAMAQIGAQGDILANDQLCTGPSSFDDPKLFVFEGKLRVSYIKSRWPSENPTCVVKVGTVGVSNLQDIIQPNFPGNDGQSMQKNAVFFERNGVLYCIWHCSPTQQIFTVSNDTVTPIQETECPRWAYGPIKGGTAPLEYDGKLLRFFHSTLDNEFAFPHKMSARRRYFMGACLMEPSAPFKTVAVSKRPIVFGSESGGSPDLFHFKPRVVFPGGAIARDGHFIVAVGVNDSQCALLKISLKELNL